MWKRVLCAIATFAVTACATPYQPKGLLGGFSEARLDETTYQVSFRGNHYTAPETVQQYVLYRAAELTSQAGYDHFVVVGAQDASRSATLTTPGTATTNGSFNAYGTGNTVTGTTTATTVYRPPQTVVIFKPGQLLTIKMGKGPKPDLPNAYDAESMLQYLGPTIKR